MSETKLINKSEEDNGYYSKRNRAQKIAFAKIQELLQRNVGKNVTKSYLQYTKDLLKTYIQNPMANQQTIREISRFICRNSMIYKKLLMYYASLPLFYYNITQINDMSKSINKNKSIKDYQNTLLQFEKYNLKKEGYTSLYLGIRDGFSVNFNHILDEGVFSMPLDVQYCRIYGKTAEGEWIVYFDGAFFDKGDNKDYIYGINNDGNGVWDKVFIDGYTAYKENGRDYEWFRLPPERTLCLTTCEDDEFTAPLPFLTPLFCSLMDLLDLENILMSRTELENYILLVSKIPLKENSEEIDDFSVSLELVQQMQQLIDAAVPDLIGTAYAPFELEKFTFEKSNSSEDTDKLSQSMQNLFNNAGASQLVVAGGSSSNAIGLKHSIQNDMATTWVWINRIQSWLNYFIKTNISEGYKLQIHQISWYNQEDYQNSMKDAATLGGSALDYLTSLGDTPYMAFQKLNFENSIGIKQLMIPLQSSYNTSSDDKKVGAPQKDEEDLSPEGEKTRSGDKNAGTKANS